MKKFLAFFIALATVTLVMPTGFAQYTPGEKKKLLVTAYYSPLPDQRFYITGSYDGDIRLNGRGTNGADGTEVFDGMLAAPKTYPFGTRILIPGLGVGEVHDRGGAIVARADYDRIDVWMGRGEEGLSRALNWGARMVEGEIWWDKNQVEPGLSYAHISPSLNEKLITKLEQKTQLSVSPTATVFEKPAENASQSEIQDLQIALTLFGLYSGPVDGALSEATKQGIVAFQLQEGILKAENEQGAGNFGPTTREKLKKKVETFNAEAEKEAKHLRQQQTLLAAGMGKDATGVEVEALQRMLWELGYYFGPISRTYDEATMEAVFAFQRAQGILSGATEAGAGFFGPQTHTALIAAIDVRIEKVKEYPKEMQTWVPVKITLPPLEQLTVQPLSVGAEKLNFDAFLNTKFVQDGNVNFSHNMALNDRGEAVTKLQNVLIKTGHLEAGLNTGYFGEKTREALIKFQLDNKIIALASESGAGTVGQKTREVLNTQTN